MFPTRLLSLLLQCLLLQGVFASSFEPLHERSSKELCGLKGYSKNTKPYALIKNISQAKCGEKCTKDARCSIFAHSVKNNCRLFKDATMYVITAQDSCDNTDRVLVNATFDQIRRALRSSGINLA